MSRILRRLYSNAAPSSSPSSASSIASQFLQRHSSAPPAKVTQLIDANQAALFTSTLPTPTSQSSSTPSYKPQSFTTISSSSSSSNVPLPPCYHLAYFTPGQATAELGADGTDASYNPEAPFTRRMWAGGELHWNSSNPISTNSPVTETTTVESAAAKRTRAGEDMVVVGVSKEFSNAAGSCLVDKRSWIFRPAIDMSNPPALTEAPAETKAFPETKYWREYTQADVTLFRFSALTFNGHKIHYSLPWCRGVEGHRGLVVHGPLNLWLMVELWRDVVARGEVAMPRSVSYRATHPLYAGEKYRVCMEDEQEGVSEVRIVDSWGNVNMKGKITRE